MPLSAELSGVVLADTITKLPENAARCVVVSGSHGGRYPGYLAARGRVRAAIFNDAGIGKDEAGVAGLCDLEVLRIPAATVSHLSCRIGDAADAVTRGIVSRVNARAESFGVFPGLHCRDAAVAFRSARPTNAEPQPFGETRSEMVTRAARRILFLDSASLVLPEDQSQIVVTGSHGGLIGGSSTMALQVNAFAAVFNDAGIGIEDAGVARLLPLDRQRIAAFTVSAVSARIGDAHSTYADGIISRANRTACRLGVREGEAAAPTVLRLAQM